MTFAIAGVSGNTGKIAAETLLSQGKKVRVIVRDEAKGKPWAARGAEVRVADLENAEALARALEGVEGAYLLSPPNFATPTFRAFQDSVSRSLVRALEISHVPHVVFLSSMGAQHPEGTGPIAGIHATEKALSTVKGTVFSFLRAGYFIENVAGSLQQLDQGILPSFTPGSKRFPVVATVDIGRLVAQLLVEGAKSTQIVELGSISSINDFADALATITGKPIKVAEGPIDAMVGVLKGAGLHSELAGLYRDMTAGINSGRITFEGTHRQVAGSTSAETVFRGLLAK